MGFFDSIGERRSGADGRGFVVHYESAEEAEVLRDFWGKVIVFALLPWLVFVAAAVFRVVDQSASPAAWLNLFAIGGGGLALLFLFFEWSRVVDREPPVLGIQPMWMVSVTVHATVLGQLVATILIYNWAWWFLVFLYALPVYWCIRGLVPSLRGLLHELGTDYERTDEDHIVRYTPVDERRIDFYADEDEEDEEGEEDAEDSGGQDGANSP